jgi:hypothetical protein
MVACPFALPNQREKHLEAFLAGFQHTSIIEHLHRFCKEKVAKKRCFSPPISGCF